MRSCPGSAPTLFPWFSPTRPKERTLGTRLGRLLVLARPWVGVSVSLSIKFVLRSATMTKMRLTSVSVYQN